MKCGTLICKKMSKNNKKQPKLNKPFRTPNGPKKFAVYVKNDKGNVVIVRFGDPNMEIKRDDPERRKAFRARHGCDNPGPHWKAKYWSCRMWSKEPVSSILANGTFFINIYPEWEDFASYPTQEELYPDGLPNFELEEIEEDE